MDETSTIKNPGPLAPELAELQRNAAAAEHLLKALSNRNRLMILCSLVGGELSVRALNERVPLSQSALSQHLAALRKAHLVSTRRVSQTIYYRIEGHEALEVIQTLKTIYCR